MLSFTRTRARERALDEHFLDRSVGIEYGVHDELRRTRPISSAGRTRSRPRANNKASPTHRVAHHQKLTVMPRLGRKGNCDAASRVGGLFV